MNRGCSLCWRRREGSSEYCVYHQAAHENLLKAYKEWRKALEIEWEDYLVAISARPESGAWVQDVARNLLEKEKVNV